ncbi:hypothetical protein BMW22_14800 [Rhizobium leguminosarum]|uniref:Uncharacterized protein n=1 Tax=Rhizobium leguminosarum TaxID=384 RepID=A0A1L3ZAS4_RHILE|nr:hypothetical protein BMW22_14800 [Rhizobium leguminosarum]
MRSFQIGSKEKVDAFWITPGSASHQAGWRQTWFASFAKSALVLGARVRRGLRPARDSPTVDCTI